MTMNDLYILLCVVKRVHCTRCDSEYEPQKMILVSYSDRYLWRCSTDRCVGQFGLSIWPVVVNGG